MLWDDFLKKAYTWQLAGMLHHVEWSDLNRRSKMRNRRDNSCKLLAARFQIINCALMEYIPRLKKVNIKIATALFRSNMLTIQINIYPATGVQVNDLFKKIIIVCYRWFGVLWRPITSHPGDIERLDQSYCRLSAHRSEEFQILLNGSHEQNEPSAHMWAPTPANPSYMDLVIHVIWICKSTLILSTDGESN